MNKCYKCLHYTTEKGNHICNQSDPWVIHEEFLKNGCELFWGESISKINNHTTTEVKC